MPMDLLRRAASGELCYLNMAEVVRPVREAAGESVLPENIVRPLGKHLALLLLALQLAMLAQCLQRLAGCRRPRPSRPDGRRHAPGQGLEVDAAGRQCRGAAAAIHHGTRHATGAVRAVQSSISTAVAGPALTQYGRRRCCRSLRSFSGSMRRARCRRSCRTRRLCSRMRTSWRCSLWQPGCAISLMAAPGRTCSGCRPRPTGRAGQGACWHACGGSARCP